MKRKYTAFTKAFKQQTLDLASQPNTCIARLARDFGCFGKTSQVIKETTIKTLNLSLLALVF
jgi:transposase-like protein